MPDLVCRIMIYDLLAEQIEPIGRLAAPRRALGAEFDTIAAVTDGCDALVATGIVLAGVCL